MIFSDSNWLRYLPSALRKKIENRPNLQAILNNIWWLFADRIFRLSVGLFIGVWFAKYLGPQQYGLWCYATAFTALFGTFATLGLDGVVVRELTKNQSRHRVLLGSSFN